MCTILWWLLHYRHARLSAHTESIAKLLLQVQHLLALEHEFCAEPVDLFPRFLRCIDVAEKEVSRSPRRNYFVTTTTPSLQNVPTPLFPHPRANPRRGAKCQPAPTHANHHPELTA
jgi:hypothetical protein